MRPPKSDFRFGISIEKPYWKSWHDVHTSFVNVHMHILPSLKTCCTSLKIRLKSALWQFMVLVTTFLFFYFLFYCSENCTVYIKLHLKHILYLLFFSFSWWFTWYFHNSPLGYRDITQVCLHISTTGFSCIDVSSYLRTLHLRLFCIYGG